MQSHYKAHNGVQHARASSGRTTRARSSTSTPTPRARALHPGGVRAAPRGAARATRRVLVAARDQEVCDQCRACGRDSYAAAFSAPAARATVVDWSSAGWAFPLATALDALCASWPRVRELNLAHNELSGLDLAGASSSSRRLSRQLAKISLGQQPQGPAARGSRASARCARRDSRLRVEGRCPARRALELLRVLALAENGFTGSIPGEWRGMRARRAQPLRQPARRRAAAQLAGLKARRGSSSGTTARSRCRPTSSPSTRTCPTVAL